MLETLSASTSFPFDNSFSVTLPDRAAATSEIDAFSSELLLLDPSCANAYFYSFIKVAGICYVADLLISSTAEASEVSVGAVALARFGSAAKAEPIVSDKAKL